MKKWNFFCFFFCLWSLCTFASDPYKSDLQKITERLIDDALRRNVNEDSVSRYMDLMRSDGSFPDLNYVNVCSGACFPAGDHLKRLDAMAVAYRKSGSPNKRDKRLLEKILFGLDYWYRVRPVSGNWWFNEIGVPQDYMLPLLLLKGEVADTILYRYSTYLKDLTGNKAHKGKNRTWVSGIVIHKGCIEDNATLVSCGFESIASTIKIVAKQGEEGIKPDRSFHQHRSQLYIGGYGLSYADDIAYYLWLARDTSFETYFTKEKKELFADFLLDGVRWFGYCNSFDFGTIGRNISRQEGLRNILPVTLKRMELCDKKNAALYKAWRMHVEKGEKSPVTGNRHYWKSDIMVQRGNNYYMSAKILSARTNGTEMLNDENLLGYNLPLGATNIQTSGKEYKDIFPLWNWTKIPGTTAVQQLDSARLEGYLFGQNDFGGGVSNGQDGIMAYVHDYRGVNARKAYFFMKDVLICLGAGISSQSVGKVVTTINQCFYRTEPIVCRNHVEKLFEEAEDSVMINPSWVYHGDVGYVFPHGGNIKLQTQNNDGSWQRINKTGNGKMLTGKVFSLYIDHGYSPQDSSYAYMVVPGKTLSDFRKFVIENKFRIEANTSEVQVVSYGNFFSFVFYVPGKITLENGLTVATDSPLLVQIEKVSDTYRIWSADPLYKQRSVYLSLNGCEKRIDFPQGDNVGSTSYCEISEFRPVGLQCEYLVNPLGIDLQTPRLSWQMGTTSTERGKRQVAYRILVSSSIDLLKSDKGDLWDSGLVHSSVSVNVPYNGKSLVSNQACYWKVQVVDEQGKYSIWSEPSFWRVGILSGDWRAKWIGSSEMEAQSVGGKKIYNKMYDPWFRKTFTLNDKVVDAILYVASIGFHELYVNGKKISDAVLVPSATDHKSRARYVAYDITSFLKKGENVIALWLGTSWAIFPAYQRDDKPAIPMVLAQTDIYMESGKKISLVSDHSWKVHSSPNLLMGYWEAHHFAGEFYDASLEINDWNMAYFDDSEWDFAKIYNPSILVSSDKTEPNKLIKEIYPLKIEEIEAGVYRVDMGINYTGWFEMQIEANPGDSVHFYFSERENSRCSFGIHSIYKMGKKGKGTFCNRFNYMTGRWVQITGLNKKPDIKQIRGWMIRPDYRRTGNFECDIPLLNSIYRTTLWSFENLSLGNYVVDCPHRERCGYGGDALATTRTAMGNYRLAAFYSKWMEDWRDVQNVSGDVPYTAPTRIGGGGPSWSGFCITLPWEFYRWYGDKRVLEENYSTIRRWLSFVETKSQHDMLVRWGGKWSFLGDWLWPKAWPERSAMEKRGKALGDTRETLFFNNCHWIYSLETAADIADVLGRTQDALDYRRRAKQVREAVHDEFFNSADNSYVNGYPSYLAIAIMVNLPPEPLKNKVWTRLEYEILNKRDGHFWGGITAGSFLMNFLLDQGRNDLIFKMAMKEDFPSWGYMLKQNLGTFFEDWECGGSGLHSSYLYIGSWFIEALGGIKRPSSGFNQFIIEPWITEYGPKLVKSHYNSIYGDIVSNWSLKSDHLNMEIVVPANTTAVLCLPKVNLNSVMEGGLDWRNVKGVKLISADDNKIVFSLESGAYNFSAILL